MKYGLTNSPTLTTSSCLILGVFHDHKLPLFAAKLAEQHSGLIKRLNEKLLGFGDVAWQSDMDGHGLMLIHCGSSKTFTSSQLTKQIAAITTFLTKQHIASATVCLPQIANTTPDWQLERMVIEFEANRYQFLEFKTKKEKHQALESVHFHLPGASAETIPIAQSIVEGIKWTRDLANMPANICTPTYLAAQAEALSQQFSSIQTKILDRDEMQKLGMNTLLAVAQGSQEPPKLIQLHYRGHDNQKPIILVGKGITFDSGGISIKPAPCMEEMKYDMGGAASVLGTLKACALLKLPINVIGLMACAENLPSGSAVKPGDIVTSLSGQTVEITNTDAEGRLVLADALTYAEQFDPKFVIDIATLTGAVIIALGHVNSGLMTEDDELAALILNAAQKSEDKTWRLPLEDAYQEAMDSPIADMLNSNPGDRTAGSITAACFLSRFTKKYRWAHLDIAGTAWVSGKNRQATGRPVPLLVQLLRDIAYAD